MTMVENNHFTHAEDGKPITFEFVFNALYAPLRFFAASLVIDKEEAKDIVAESFSKFWKVRERFERMIEIKAFLFQMVRNACIDYLRKVKTKEKHIDHLLYQERFSERNIELLENETELITQLYHEIEKLPQQRKEVFKLTYLQGLSTGEVAAVLNISTSTVYDHNQKAINALRIAFSGKDLMVLLIILSARIFNN